MTPWGWYAGELDELTYDLACDEPTREAAIREACRNLRPGEQFQIVEARSSTDRKYEGSDCVPFLRTRNKEILTAVAVATTEGQP
jgi:hypothetical protein